MINIIRHIEKGNWEEFVANYLNLSNWEALSIFNIIARENNPYDNVMNRLKKNLRV